MVDKRKELKELRKEISSVKLKIEKRTQTLLRSPSRAPMTYETKRLRPTGLRIAELTAKLEKLQARERLLLESIELTTGTYAQQQMKKLTYLQREYHLAIGRSTAEAEDIRRQIEQLKAQM